MVSTPARFGSPNARIISLGVVTAAVTSSRIAECVSVFLERRAAIFNESLLFKHRSCLLSSSCLEHDNERNMKVNLNSAPKLNRLRGEHCAQLSYSRDISAPSRPRGGYHRNRPIQSVWRSIAVPSRYCLTAPPLLPHRTDHGNDSARAAAMLRIP